MVFISHARPEDDEFARWLALRLAAEGFPVWCDLTHLLGGEDFWTDIEDAIRQRTVKFLYVLSRTSNRKPGPLSELDVAKKVQRSAGLRDFIVPLGIDDLPHSELNIELTRLNVISFQPGWHLGLAPLIEKLEVDGVARQPRFNPAAVASWWRERVNGQHAIRRSPEVLATNVYPLRPARLYFHKLAVALEDAPIEAPSLSYPAERFADYLVSFAPAADLAPTIGTGVKITDSLPQTVGSRQAHPKRHHWTYRDERATLTKLLNRSWQNMLAARGLSTYQFATGSPAYYFKTGSVEKDTIHFQKPDGSPGSRQVIGYRTMHHADGSVWIRHWHFALEARPTVSPTLGFVMKPHVLFSDDGMTIWDSADRLARARRSQCRQWWNNDWRDLTYAAVQFLADDNGRILLRTGADIALEVRAEPVQVLCPVSYDEQLLKEDSSASEVVADQDLEDFESDEEG